LRLTAAKKVLRLFAACLSARGGAALGIAGGEVQPRRARLRHARVVMFAALLLVFGARTAFATLTVTPSTFNVVGLDSNDVTAGPDTFPVGVLVCNTGGTTVSGITGTFFWDTSNIYINLSGLNPVTTDPLAAGQCTNLFFNVTVTRSTSAYNQTRRYHINVTATGEPTYTTPSPREIYVEHLVSQNRNSTQSVTGPSNAIVGQTYTYTVNASTATNGYEQLESFLSFPNTMFEVLSISTTYTAPSGATNNKVYADACGWDNNPLSPTYRSCIGPTNYSGGKAGGTLTTVYTVKIIGSGTATLNSMIYDFSGSSYHYGNNVVISSLSAQTPPNVALVKDCTAPANCTTQQQTPGTDLTYTISFSNSGQVAAQSFIITDPIPANTDFKVGSVTTALGGLSSVAVAYSNDGGLSYTYTPASGGGGALAGYDRNVTHVRWAFTGTLGSGSGNVTFTARIR
jgi:uncharacterized repeat protein (TIGR01451 family)